MDTKQRTTVRSGLFTDQTSAEEAYKATLKSGYTPNDVNVIMSEDTRNKFFPNAAVATQKGDKSMEGLALGGALGGATVGVLAAVVALATPIAIPGLILIGPLAAGLAGAGAGSIAGGLIGALIGAGITEDHAKIYEQGIKQGGTVLVVKSFGKEKDDALLDEWRKNHVRDIY